MTWPIGEWVTSLKEQLTSYGDTTLWRDKPSDANRNDKAPRYFWFPVIGTGGQGGHHGGTNPIALSGVTVHVVVECWGSSYDTSWALVNNLVRAASSAAGADAKFSKLEWMHAEADGSILENGSKVLVTYTLDVPFVDAVYATTDLTSAHFTAKAHFASTGNDVTAGSG